MKGIIVVKLGGVASNQLSPAFFKQIYTWKAQGKKIVFVHGGGNAIQKMVETLQVATTFKNGLRVTTEAVLEVAKMVLIGQVQPQIVQQLQQAGLAAIGLNAADNQLLSAKVIDYATYGYVGEITHVETQLLVDLISKEYMPIIAPLGITSKQEWLNVNADSVACKVAEALHAEHLFLLTDVPGIRANNQWLTELSLAEMKTYQKDGAISGGMIPKINSALAAIQSGVASVSITNNLHHQGTIIRNCEVNPQ